MRKSFKNYSKKNKSVISSESRQEDDHNTYVVSSKNNTQKITQKIIQKITEKNEKKKKIK